MLTNDERREIAARLREEGNLRTFAEAVGFSWEDETDWRWRDVAVKYADLIEPEPICIANITFTAEQQEELFQRVMEELRVNGCPNCGAKAVE